MESKNLQSRIRTDEIKKALLTGGLVFSARRSGKTQALTQIILEDSSAYLITCTEEQAAMLRDTIPDSNKDARDRIYSASSAEKRMKGAVGKIFVDEKFWNPYKGHYYAAVSSLPDDYVGPITSLYE